MGNNCNCEMTEQAIDFKRLKRRNEKYETAQEKDDKIWFELTPTGFKTVSTPYYAHPSDIFNN